VQHNATRQDGNQHNGSGMNDIHHNDTLQNDTEQNNAQQNDTEIIIVLAKYNFNSVDHLTYKYFYEIISTKYLTLSTPSVCLSVYLWRTHGSQRGVSGGINGVGRGWENWEQICFYAIE
jgi:hypothetical protein